MSTPAPPVVRVLVPGTEPVPLKPESSTEYLEAVSPAPKAVTPSHANQKDLVPVVAHVEEI